MKSLPIQIDTGNPQAGQRLQEKVSIGRCVLPWMPHARADERGGQLRRLPQNVASKTTQNAAWTHF
jgi:hypothetical protein